MTIFMIVITHIPNHMRWDGDQLLLLLRTLPVIVTTVILNWTILLFKLEKALCYTILFG